MGDANVPDHFLRYDHEVTKSVVVDYIRYRLCKESLEWNSDKYFDSQQQRQPSKICLTMRTLASELEEKYRQTFNEMCNDLNITPASAENIFSAVTTELFNGGIQWGTIVALFAFAGCMAVKCQRTEMSVLIDSIADWIITYCDEKLQPWMNDHGAWVNIVFISIRSLVKVLIIS